MAMKQRQPGIIGGKLDLRLLIPAHHHYVFDHAPRRLACEFRQLKAVPVQMDGVHIVARVTHAQAVPSALPQMVCGRHRSARKNLFIDRKSTRLNSSHGYISYAVFCLKKKKSSNSALHEAHSLISLRD